MSTASAPRLRALSTRARLLLAATAAASALLLLCALALPAPAQALSSWWHLTSGARPTYLKAGVGKPGKPGVPGEDEVQEITAPLEEFEGVPEQGAFV